MRRLTACIALVMAALALAQDPAAKPAPQRRPTVLGSAYLVDPRFDKVISGQIARARRLIQERRAEGKFIAYLSVPISAHGGGDKLTNAAIAKHTAQTLQRQHGERLWVLDPNEFQLLKVDGLKPQGGDYLYMWSEILAGVDGKGDDFDLVYFLGPTDVDRFFSDHLGDTCIRRVESYLNLRLKVEEGKDLAAEIAARPERRREFLAFYAFRASVAYSKGAHDEWNLFVRINKKRGVGNQIPCWFDGRALSPAEMETELAPGYELR